LVCLQDGTSHLIGSQPLVIGRAVECDLLVEDPSVSRQHACVIRTPTGYVVVDSSSHGTYVNCERIQAQHLLQSGDVIQVGNRAFRFDFATLPPPPDRDAASPTHEEPPVRRWPGTGKIGLLRAIPPNRGRAREWIVRYGIAEIVGAAAAFGAFWLVQSATESRVVAAYAAALAEGTGFYLTLLLRELIRDAYAAGAHRAVYGPRQMFRSLRTLFVEFGPAELIDTGVTRPLCFGLATVWLGPQLGILVGKVAADVIFYGPVIAAHEVRLHRSRTR
jgi:hypothetical protein